MVCQDSFLEPNISTIQHAFGSVQKGIDIAVSHKQNRKLQNSKALLSKMSLSTIAVRSPAILKVRRICAMAEGEDS